ncbi:unnamed protein product [Paramecium pentaurelia]|uniref:Uncharacterized protein n=1 Tax=Paramecium pentaurelia TaxID=43138 RepID=A0A8S1SSM8_9CILI|nr:unnamed protein product [Paramecium pentaurelia]
MEYDMQNSEKIIQPQNQGQYKENPFQINDLRKLLKKKSKS